jgi:hypothetical protein
LIDTPGVPEATVPFHYTGPETCPPAEAKLAGTGKASPERKISSLPEIGTVAIHVFVIASKDVEAQAAFEENVIRAGPAKS